MFGYSELALFECFMQYPNTYSSIPPKMMQLLLSCALPLLNDVEKQEMELLRNQYEVSLKELTYMVNYKKKTAMDCIQLLKEAMGVYDKAFNRVANAYFGRIYS